MNNNLNKFTGLYQLSKTLRFELKPVGKTRENIDINGFLVNDEHRAESYKKVKKIIDRYHKSYIDSVLSNFSLNEDVLENYYDLYTRSSKTEKEAKEFEAIQDYLRKSISTVLKKDERFKRIDKKELIREDMLAFLTDEEEKSLVGEFHDFTTYFTGFHQNRQNMYSPEAKSTSIAYRLIHDNLPKFIDNIAVFKQIAETPVADNFLKIYKENEEYLNVNSIDEMFDISYYSMVLTQTQIEVYNSIIGGRTLEDGTKLQGLNEYINHYNQNLTDKRERLPKLKPLFKQILSDRAQLSWLPEEFKTGSDVIDAVKEYCNLYYDNIDKGIKALLTSLNDYDISKIYVPNDLQLTDISQRMFGNWSVIPNAIEQDLRNKNHRKTNETEEKYAERIAKLKKQQKSFSLVYINECLRELKDADLATYFASLGAQDTAEKQTASITSEIDIHYNQLRPLFSVEYSREKNLSQDKLTVMQLKDLLDAFKALQRFVKPLLGNGDEAEKDEKFYGELMQLWEIINDLTPLYNKVRNYATRKPYSTEKIKLTFDIKGNLLGGWVDSKTEKSDNGTQYGGYLFRRKNSIGEYDYYLGVSANTKLFRRVDGVSGQYERLDYYQPKSQTVYGNSYVGVNGYEKDKQALIHSIVAYVREINDSNIEQLVLSKDTPSAMLTVIKEKSLHLYDGLLKDTAFSEINKTVTRNLRETILSMNRIPGINKYEDMNFSIFTEPQQVIEEICKGKMFGYFTVDDKEMTDAMEDSVKPFLLFKITNKDLSYVEKNEKGLRKSRGTDNLHTMYFKALMSGNQSVLDLGSGEVFYRRASIPAKVTHPANVVINNKNVNNKKKESKFGYDLIKDRRYSVDKFSFHLSIIQNYKCPKTFDINNLAKEYIRDNQDIHFIGIDRGERHLLYLCVINGKGNIVEQYSLNEIVNEYKGNEYRTDYHDLLQERDKKRLEERSSWQTIEGIKELKQGYLSQVIHKIAQLIVKYNAIVILEDLNMGFKRGRQKVESSVYQQFEKALIDKLNYLVDKSKTPTEEGGLLKAYQLASKFESFQKMGKQSGFLFYVPAWNTSKIDPVTGFVNLLDTRYDNIAKAQAFFNKFESIRYNEKKDWFELAFDYDNFTAKAEGTKTRWTLCTYGTRIDTFRNDDKNSNWDSKEVNLTEEWKTLFTDYNIPYKSNLKEAIIQQSSKDYYVRLLHLLKLTLQIRNSVTGTDIDYMISPVADAKGEFFDSRKADKSLPENADANGAYNIARKGLWLAQQIREAEDLSTVKLAITNKEWLLFAQTKPHLM